MSDNEDYTIEKIITKKKRGDTWLYLIKWVGFTEEENTWEPYENIRNCKKEIRDFEKIY